MTFRIALFTMGCIGAFAGVSGAQQPRQQADSVPKAYRPPPGMCRIWLDKVPPKEQPAPTDCRTAVHDKPANGRVIFGDDFVDKRRKADEKDPPFIKKFGETPKKP
jgi:hypothetical protein